MFYNELNRPNIEISYKYFIIKVHNTKFYKNVIGLI
jgi:hypothetical protein